MNKFITKLAKIFLGLSMAAGVGVAVGASKKGAGRVDAADTILTFATGSNTGTKSTTSEYASTLFASASQSYVTGKITTATNVYASTASGLRIGNSSATGCLKFSLTSAINASTVVVRAKRYNTGKASTINFNSGTAQSLPTDGSWKDCSFSVTGSLSTIQLDANYYLYVEKITITTSGGVAPEGAASSSSFDTSKDYYLKTTYSSTDYYLTSAASNWGKVSSSSDNALRFRLSGSTAAESTTITAKTVISGSDNYLNPSTGNFTFSNSSKNLTLKADGKIYNPNSSTYFLRYNHNSGNGGLRWYSTDGNAAYFVEAPTLYVITYDKNAEDATGTMQNTTGTSVSAAACGFSRTGYTFSGWNTQPGGGGTSYAVGASVNATVTLYAQWTINKYTVTYNKNTSDTVTDMPTQATNINYGTVYTLSNATPVRSGYSFDGWSTIEGDNNSSGKVTSITVDGNKDVYAIWVQNGTYYDVNWTGNHDHLSFSSTSVTHVLEGEGTTITIEADQYYKAPTSIIVSGAGTENDNWSYSDGELTILEMNSNVTVQATAAAAVIDEIIVEVDPSESSFYLGHEFTHETAVVTGVYDDKQETEVDVTSFCTWSSPDMFTTGEKTVTVTYAVGIEDTYTITVGTKIPITGGIGRVTDVADLTVGSTVYIVAEDLTEDNESVNKQLSGFGGTTYGTGATYTTALDATVMPLTIVEGSADDTIAFQIDEDEYLHWGSGNSLDYSDEVTNESSWTVSISDGDATISNYGTPARIIWWNIGSPRFACYTDKTDGTQYRVTQIYKNYPSVPAELIKIEASLKSGTYYIGNSVTAADFTVTAYYDDGTNSPVTATSLSNAYLETSSTDVTVSYTESGITKSAVVNVQATAKPINPIVVLKDSENEDVTSSTINVYGDSEDIYFHVDIDNFEGTITYTWSSDNNSVAVISDDDGTSCGFDVLDSTGTSNISCRVVGSTKGDVAVSLTLSVTAVQTTVSWNAPTINVYSGTQLSTASWNVRYSTNSGIVDEIPESYKILLGGVEIASNHTWVVDDDEKALCVQVNGSNSSSTTVYVTQYIHSVWKDSGSSTKVSDLTFTKACGGTGTANDGKSWTVTSDASESNFIDGSGIHYGTNNASVQYIQLDNSDIAPSNGNNTIKKIEVNARDYHEEATLSVTVGGEAFGTSQTLTNTSTAYEFTGSAKGAIVVRADRGESETKAMYVLFVKVTYEGPDPDVDIANSDSHITAQRAAVKFANAFNTAVSNGGTCNADPVNGTSVSWEACKTAYSTFLSEAASDLDYAKNLLIYATKEYSDNSGEACIERMMKTYEILCGRGYDEFMSSFITLENAPRLTSQLTIQNTNTIAIIVIISMVSVTAVGGYFFLRKRKENN